MILPAAVLMTSAAAAQIRVHLRDQASAGGTTILLGDVADVQSAPPALQQSLAAISLGFAPSGDAERVLTRGHVRRALDRSGVDLADAEIDGAAEVRVKASTRLLDPEHVARAIQARLAEEYPGGLLKLTALRVSLNGQIQMPIGEFTLIPTWSRSSPKPSDLMTIDLFSGKQRLRRFQAHVEWEWEADVGVVARNLPFGHVLSDGDIRWAAQKRRDAPAGLVLQAGMLTGMRLRRPLQAGDLITRDALAAPRLVEKGDMVQLALRSKGFSILTTGTAQQAGESGDKIRVLRTNSKRVFVGTVVGKNQVAIVL